MKLIEYALLVFFIGMIYVILEEFLFKNSGHFALFMIAALQVSIYREPYNDI